MSRGDVNMLDEAVKSVGASAQEEVMFKYKYKFLRKKGWVGVVYKIISANSLKPITAIVKRTEKEIKDWCEEAIRCIAKEGLN